MCVYGLGGGDDGLFLGSLKHKNTPSNIYCPHCLIFMVSSDTSKANPFKTRGLMTTLYTAYNIQKYHIQTRWYFYYIHNTHTVYIRLHIHNYLKRKKIKLKLDLGCWVETISLLPQFYILVLLDLNEQPGICLQSQQSLYTLWLNFGMLMWIL